MKNSYQIFSTEYQSYQLGSLAIFGLIAMPAAILGVLATFLLFPATTELTEWLLKENRPIEILSFLFAIAASFVGIRLGSRWARRNYRLGTFFGYQRKAGSRDIRGDVSIGTQLRRDKRLCGSAQSRVSLPVRIQIGNDDFYYTRAATTGG